MKKRLLLICAAAALGLSGCVAVPVYDAQPAYGYYYGPPAAAVTFGYYGQRHYHHAPRPRRY